LRLHVYNKIKRGIYYYVRYSSAENGRKLHLGATGVVSTVTSSRR